MDMYKDFEATLVKELKSDLYELNSKLKVDRLREIASKYNYAFYHIDGKIVTDHPSFFVALTHTFEWPQQGGSNWDAIFDVITEPRYYEPHGKGIILFDQCHNLARTDMTSFNIVVGIFKDMPARFDHYLQHPSMKDRKPFLVYILLGGEEDVFKRLSEENLPIPTFLNAKGDVK